MDTRELHVERSTSTAHRLTHYDGVCGNVHGHNLEWEAELTVRFDPEDEAAMPLDLKVVADVIDITDHATLLYENDPLVQNQTTRDSLEAREYVEDLLGSVIWFSYDPTCEVVVEWMADRLLGLSDVIAVAITLNETDKYGVATSAMDDLQ